jgi:hypothetical protein
VDTGSAAARDSRNHQESIDTVRVGAQLAAEFERVAGQAMNFSHL